MKKILLIGGGTWQVPIAQQIKQAGHTLICSNLYKDSPCFELADHSHVIDVLNKKRNLALAQAYHIDAVVTDQSDIAVPTVAYVAENMNIPGVSESIAELFTNKFLMRSELLASSVNHPKYAVVKNVEQAAHFFITQETWMICKPLCNQSSRGVNLVKTLSELADAVEDTLRHSKTNSFLVEQYIPGQEVTVEGFKGIGEAHRVLGISKKRHLSANSNIACELEYVPDIDKRVRQKLENATDEIFQNVLFAITHAEFKVHEGEVYLIEAAIRGGGTKISSHIIPRLSGMNVNNLLIKSALGEPLDYIHINVSRPYAMLKFFNFQPGLVTYIHTPPRKDWPSEVIDFCLEFSVGDTLSSPNDDRSRHGYVILSAATHEALHSALNYMENTLHVEIRREND